MIFKPRKTSPRLPSFDYAGGYAYHIILATRARVPRFENGRLVAFCLDRLAASAERYEFRVLAYCFMPDHLHLLVLGDERARLIRLVQHFKQATGFRHSGLWQRSFYDRVLRREEDLSDIADYIWSNPVVAGLAGDAREYPHSGSREVIEAEGRLTTEKSQDRAKALSLRGSSMQAAPQGEERLTIEEGADRAKALSLRGSAT